MAAIAITWTIGEGISVAFGILGFLGTLLASEHTKNKTKRNWDKHSGRRSGGSWKKPGGPKHRTPGAEGYVKSKFR